MRSVRNSTFLQEESYISRLEELRNYEIDVPANMRILRFCQLIQEIDDNEKIQSCYLEVARRNDIIEEIQAIENKLIDLVVIYKDKGNFEKAKQILDKISMANKFFDRNIFEQEYVVAQSMQRKEDSALKKWAVVTVLTVIVAIIIIIA